MTAMCHIKNVMLDAKENIFIGGPGCRNSYSEEFCKAEPLVLEGYATYK